MSAQFSPWFYVFLAVLGLGCYTQNLSAQSVKEADESIASLTLKANAGDTGAQTTLGMRYSEGTGVQKNDQISVQWFRRAAEKGKCGGSTKTWY